MVQLGVYGLLPKVGENSRAICPGMTCTHFNKVGRNFTKQSHHCYRKWPTYQVNMVFWLILSLKNSKCKQWLLRWQSPTSTIISSKGIFYINGFLLTVLPLGQHTTHKTSLTGSRRRNWPNTHSRWRWWTKTSHSCTRSNYTLRFKLSWTLPRNISFTT